MSENITAYAVEPAIEVKNAKITEVRVVNLGEDKKKLATQRCQVSNKSCRYLFTLEREDGETLQVSSEILRKHLEVTQKTIDKLYCLAYYSEHPTASTAVTEEAKEAKVAEFIGE